MIRHSSNFIDLTGREFGRLVVQKFVSREYRGKKKAYWECVCNCGNENIVIVSSGNLTRGNTISCGCFKREKTIERTFKHGMSKTVEHRVYCGIINRCYNKNSDDYKDYGGRGITVCDRWLGENGFKNFYQDMGYRPSLKHSIGRINNNNNYSDNNCEWQTSKEQANNRRSSKLITFNGETKTIAQWSEATGIKDKILYHRITKAKWSIEKALTEPVRRLS